MPVRPCDAALDESVLRVYAISASDSGRSTSHSFDVAVASLVCSWALPRRMHVSCAFW